MWETRTPTAEPDVEQYAGRWFFRRWILGPIQGGPGQGNASRREASGLSGCLCQTQNRVAQSSRRATRAWQHHEQCLHPRFRRRLLTNQAVIPVRTEPYQPAYLITVVAADVRRRTTHALD